MRSSQPHQVITLKQFLIAFAGFTLVFGSTNKGMVEIPNYDTKAQCELAGLWAKQDDSMSEWRLLGSYVCISDANEMRKPKVSYQPPGN